MTRKGEKGSVVSFIVVGVLLAALVIGGLYTLKERSFFGIGQQSETVETDEAAGQIANQTSDEKEKPESSTSGDKSSDQKSPEESEPSTPSAPSTTSDDSDKSSDSSTTEPSAPITSSDDSQSSAQQSKTPQSSSSSNSSSTAASELPQTGPGDTILAFVGPAALVGAFLAYRRSYQL